MAWVFVLFIDSVWVLPRAAGMRTLAWESPQPRRPRFTHDSNLEISWEELWREPWESMQHSSYSAITKRTEFGLLTRRSTADWFAMARCERS